MTTTSPTPATPLVVNDDGTLSMLLFQGRTNRLAITHRGLLDPTGYAARACWRASYAGDALLEASTEDGSIVMEAVVDEDDAPAGTMLTITLTDESCDEVAASRGVWDVLVESPGGEETPVIPSSPWRLWKKVAE